jgi:phosphoribosylformimino-5-aminoimidazole carboxamide ribotide isomerase
MADIEAAFAAGAARVILGTAALEGDLLTRAGRLYGDRVAVALDVRDGQAVKDGWQRPSAVKAHEVAALLRQRGARRLIYTDVRRDGMLEGPDVAGLTTLVARVGVPVIISGGIRSVADLQAAARAGAEGAIIGRALYDGRLTLRDALGVAVEVR